MTKQSTMNMTNKQKRELAKAMFAPASGRSSSTVTSTRAAAPVRRQQRQRQRQQRTVPSTRASSSSSSSSARALTAAEKAARRLQAEEWARKLARGRGLDYDNLEDEASPSPPDVNGAEAAVRPQPQQQPVHVETAARLQSQQRRRRRSRRRQASSPVVETVSEEWRVGTTTEWDEPVVMVPVAVAEEEQFWDAAQFVQEPRPKADRAERRRARAARAAAIRLEGEVRRAASRRKLDEELRKAEQHLAHLRRLGRHQMIRLVLTGAFQVALVAGALAVASSW